MVKLSVVIITFNEEQNIARCLKSVKDVADDIVVVDSFSTDTTEQICRKYNVNFIKRKWEGYSDTKNYANSQAKFDWILSMDADEALSVELKNSIINLKNKNELTLCSFNRLTNYCGTWIRHSGWYPDVKTRLFNRTNTQWQGSIHEQLVSSIPVKVFHLKGDCLHYSYYSIEQHKNQAEKFSQLWVQSSLAEGRRSSVLKVVFKPMVTFIRAYIFYFGFLDGPAGLTIARISAWATYLRYSELFKLQK